VTIPARSTEAARTKPERQSPVAALFVAVGLVAAPIVRPTAAFSPDGSSATPSMSQPHRRLSTSLGSVIQTSVTSPAGIALQLVMLAGLVALLRVDWARILTSRQTNGAPHGTTNSLPIQGRCSERRHRSLKRWRPAAAPPSASS
jgi:hypothetical protein